MALTAGIKHLRDGIEPQTVVGSDMSTICVVGPAPAADATAFPLNRPVFLKTDDSVTRTLLGATGTVPQALDAISAQLSGSARSAKIVVVRTDPGADTWEAIANIVGNEAARTGIWAALDAPADLGEQPRIFIVPGYTSQSQTGLEDPVISVAGNSGTDGTFALAFSGGTGSGAAGTFTVVSGAIADVTITDKGVYTVVPTLDFSASANLTGQTVTVAIEQLANSVCATIPTVLSRMGAVFIPEGPTNTRQAYLDWFETLPASIRVFHPLRQDAKVLDENGDTVTRPLSPFIAALYVRVDSENDGVPSSSIMNQNVYGLVGLSPSIHLSLTDETSQGQLDLAISAGIIARGDIGVYDSPGATGFSFWGTDTLSALSEERFTHAARMRDYMEIMQVKITIPFLGKNNITLQVVEAVMNSLKMELTKLAKDGHILSPFKVGFDADANTSAELRLGEIDVSFNVEEPPVLRKIIIRSRKNIEALDILSQNIAVQLNGNQS